MTQILSIAAPLVDDQSRMTHQWWRAFSALFNQPARGTPVSSSARGTPGTIMYDDAYLYICVAQDQWRRVAIATF